MAARRSPMPRRQTTFVEEGMVTPRAGRQANSRQTTNSNEVDAEGNEFILCIDDVDDPAPSYPTSPMKSKEAHRKDMARHLNSGTLSEGYGVQSPRNSLPSYREDDPYPKSPNVNKNVSGHSEEEDKDSCVSSQKSNKNGIGGKIKNRLKIPAKRSSKKRVNSIKKAQRYVNSLHAEEDPDNRSVTPIFDEEENLEVLDFIKKRNELLLNPPSPTNIDEDGEITIDLTTPDDRVGKAMERRLALMKTREERKNSLKLEGIVEESPPKTPINDISMITPEDYDDYLENDIGKEYQDMGSDYNHKMDMDYEDSSKGCQQMIGKEYREMVIKDDQEDEPSCSRDNRAYGKVLITMFLIEFINHLVRRFWLELVEQD